MIRFLSDFCRGHRLDEKIFVVPSFSIGRQVGEALAGAGEAWANLRFMTLPSLAHEAAAVELARAGKKQLSATELLVHVDGLFRELLSGGRLEYFNMLSPKPGVVRAVYRAIESLRLAKISSSALESGSFVVAAKGRDMARLLGRYEELLESTNALDLPGLYLFALGRMHDPAPAWVLCLEDHSLSRLERELVQARAGLRLVRVPRDPVVGLEPPRRPWGQDSPDATPPAAPASDVERLPWLFAPQAAPPPVGDGSVEIFRAVGHTNECREVLRRITAEKISYDRVEIIHPPGAPHPAVFHVLAARTGLPVTLAGGIPLAFTAPGRVYFGLLDWIERSFLVSDLCRLIEAGDFEFPGGREDTSPAPLTVSGFLKASGIGWGRERYIERLRTLRETFEARLSAAPHGEEAEETEAKGETFRRSIAEIDGLVASVSEFLALIPDIRPKEAVDFQGFCEGLLAAIRSSVRLPSVRRAGPEFDREALDALAEELRRISGGDNPPPAGSIVLEEAIERLRTLGSSLTVGASSPLPGHLHLSDHHSGGYTGRPVTFLVGLEDTDFPGHGLQDPVLLDAERERLSPSLPTTADALREGLHSMAAMLASLRGRVIFSYPSYDIIEERASFPSSLVLQVHRLIRGDAELDYSNLEAALPEAAGFLPDGLDKVFDEMDWWLGRLSHNGKLLDGLATVRANFPDLANGITAVEARESDTLTAFEGIVSVDRQRYDPLVNHALSLSASRLESLAKCPYGYFLRYILGIEPPDELERDPSRWLDPMARGSLLHEILFSFMTAVLEKRERVDPARHAPLMKDIASRLILDMKREIPPPSEGIFEKEKRDMMESLAIFLELEAKRPGNVEPLEFEKRFDGIEIDLGSQSGRRSFFVLRGFIDRIDRTGPGTYRIVDYKTGGSTAYEKFVAFGRGKVIQHALYAIAAEKFLPAEKSGRPARVVQSGYYFPTRRGEGREIMVDEFDRRRFAGLLGDLLTLVTKGYFVAGPEASCDFCDFAAVCGGAPAEMKRKAEANRKIFEALDRLKSYD
jgi:RecB family exonuclease